MKCFQNRTFFSEEEEFHASCQVDLNHTIFQNDSNFVPCTEVQSTKYHGLGMWINCHFEIWNYQNKKCDTFHTYLYFLFLNIWLESLSVWGIASALLIPWCNRTRGGSSPSWPCPSCSGPCFWCHDEALSHDFLSTGGQGEALHHDDLYKWTAILLTSEGCGMVIFSAVSVLLFTGDSCSKASWHSTLAPPLPKAPWDMNQIPCLISRRACRTSITS